MAAVGAGGEKDTDLHRSPRWSILSQNVQACRSSHKGENRRRGATYRADSGNGDRVAESVACHEHGTGLIAARTAGSRNAAIATSAPAVTAA